MDPLAPPYSLCHDPQQIDVAAVHAFLVRSAWSPGIPRSVVERAIAGSLCVGLFHGAQQVGFARAVSDGATFAYLCDVYVLEAHRGRGLGKAVVAALLERPELQRLRRMLLATADAHGLYAGFGFAAPAHPERLMEILRPDIYRQSMEAS